MNILVNLSLFIPPRAMEENISSLPSDWRDTLEKAQLLVTQEPQELYSGHGAFANWLWIDTNPSL